MNFTKYVAILALFFYAAIASEINDFKVSNPNVSIYKIPNVACHNILTYLDSPEFYSLSLANKYFYNVIKEWIDIFFPKFSPKLRYFSDYKLKLTLFLFIISIFPGIESINDGQAQTLFSLAKKNNYFYEYTGRLKIKNIILAIIQILFDGSIENIMAIVNLNSTPLIVATIYGNIEIVGFFIKNGANVNDIDNCGETALLRALDYGLSEIAEFLI